MYFVVSRRGSKVAKTDYYLRQVCPSVRPREAARILICVFLKSAEKVQVSLTSGKNNGYLT